jgi:hypothetical protein
MNDDITSTRTPGVTRFWRAAGALIVAGIGFWALCSVAAAYGPVVGMLVLIFLFRKA